MTTKLVENKFQENGTATFELDINTQMWAGVYIEPIKGIESTYEDEHKRFTFDYDTYEVIRVKLRKKTEELQQDIYKCLGYELSCLTYSEVSVIHGSGPVDGVPESFYTASEDLVFLYGSLHEIWECMYELECVFK